MLLKQLSDAAILKILPRPLPAPGYLYFWCFPLAAPLVRNRVRGVPCWRFILAGEVTSAPNGQLDPDRIRTILIMNRSLLRCCNTVQPPVPGPRWGRCAAAAPAAGAAERAAAGRITAGYPATGQALTDGAVTHACDRRHSSSERQSGRSICPACKGPDHCGATGGWTSAVRWCAGGALSNRRPLVSRTYPSD